MFNIVFNKLINTKRHYKLFKTSRIILHPFFISSSLIVRGGDILKAFFSHNNLKRRTLFLIHISIILPTISSFSTMAANISPFPLISIILGCFNSFLKRASFLSIWLIKFESLSSLNVARDAAAITGFPPK